MKREYYNELRDHIKNTVPEMRYVGYFNDQFNKERSEQSIDDPCCLLAFKPQDIQDMGGGFGIQKYKLLVTAYIGWSNFKDQGEDILDFAEKVNIAMHRFVPSSTLNTFGKLLRIDERPNYDHDQRIVHEIDYLVEVVDYTADNRSTKTLTVTPVITATIETTI